MAQNETMARVALVTPRPHRLALLAGALNRNPGWEFMEFQEALDTVGARVVTAAPNVTVLFSPTVGEPEKRFLERVLRGSQTEVLLLVNEPLRSDSGYHAHPRVHVYMLSRAGNETPASLEGIQNRIRMMLQRQRLNATKQAVAQASAQVSAQVSATQAASAKTAARPQAQAPPPAARPQPAPPSARPQAAAGGQREAQPENHPPLGANMQLSPNILAHHLIAIGASTGGTEALARLFRSLPPNMPGIVVVQHMPPVFTQMYAERLDRELPFRVMEARDQVVIQPNSIHIAPGDRQLMVKKRGSQYLTILGGTEKVSGHCPSADVLFESVANEARNGATGIILTGMGADGALGLVSMRKKGAYTLGQDEASCVVYGMPRKAFEFGGVVKQASLDDIPKFLVGHLAKLD